MNQNLVNCLGVAIVVGLAAAAGAVAVDLGVAVAMAAYVLGGMTGLFTSALIALPAPKPAPAFA